MDLKSGKEIGPRIKFGQDGLNCVSPDGRFGLRTRYGSSTDHGAELWDLTTDRSVWPLARSDGKVDAPWVQCSVFSRNMRTLSVGFSDGTIRVYEWSTRTERLRFSRDAGIQQLAYSPDGTRLASAGARWGLVWNLTAPQSANPASKADAWAGLAGTDGRGWAASATSRPGRATRSVTSRTACVPSPTRNRSRCGSSNWGRMISTGARTRTSNSRGSRKGRGATLGGRDGGRFDRGSEPAGCHSEAARG